MNLIRYDIYQRRTIIMHHLIIYAHPNDGSFNHHVLSFTQDILKGKEDTVDVIDLYHDEFNPVMTKEELASFSSGVYHDPKAEDYLNRIKASDHVILIFPVWRFGPPAILKGFFDKVFIKEAAYLEPEVGNMVGVLGVKKTSVFTTASFDKDVFEIFGDPISNTLNQGILNIMGIENATWIHGAPAYLESERDAFLESIKSHLNQ